jgi:hypothetical protein
MAQVSRTVAKTYFETNDKPTQQQFADFIDSAAWYDEIPSGGGASGGPASEAFGFTAGSPQPGGINPNGTVMYWGDVPVITNPSNGLFVVTFGANSTPHSFRIALDSGSMSGGAATVRFVLPGKFISSVIKVKRADGSNKVLFDLEGENVSVNEAVTVGQTNIVFNNLNNINKVEITINLTTWE